MSQLALYGHVAMRRAYCAKCVGYALVLGGKLQCCDRPEATEINEVVRMIEPEDVRTKCSTRVRKRILKEQDYRCFWCYRRLGSLVRYKGKMRRLKTHIDHVIPHAFSQDNSEVNLVGSCCVCNHWKTDYVFQSIEDVRLYLATRWEQMAEEYGGADVAEDD